MFSIEILPDEATDAAVRAAWDRLIAADLPSAGRHPGASNRPHVTLAVGEAVDLDAVRPLTARLPLPLRIGAPLVFGSFGEADAGARATLVCAVTATPALLSLQGAAHAAVTGPAPLTAPERWAPHVTLARRVRLEALPAVLRAARPDEIAGTAVALRVWDAGEKRIVWEG